MLVLKFEPQKLRNEANFFNPLANILRKYDKFKWLITWLIKLKSNFIF